MKFSHFLILSLLSILCFAFTALSNPYPFSDGVTPSPVLDADGERLQAGVNYLVLPGRGGGHSPEKTNEKSSCPGGIIQEAGEIQRGFPVRFSPVHATTGSVPFPVSHGPPQPVPFSYAPPPPVPFLHAPPPPPLPPPPIPFPHAPPPPVPEPNRPPPPVPVPHTPPPPVPEPHRPPPPPVPVPAGPPPPDTSLAVTTLESPAYARPFVIFVSVLIYLGLN